MRRVLITGGAGFIGYHLASSLVADGISVDLLDDFSRGVRDDNLAALLERPEVTTIEANLLDQQAVEALSDEYAEIYHLAAIIGVQHVMNRPYAVLTDNVRMLEHVLELSIRQKKLDRLLFASTSEIYAGSVGFNNAVVPTPEDTLIALPDLSQPRTSYMLSKLYGEAMCLQSGVPVTIIRPHNFYGPRMGMSHVVPELLKKTRDIPDGGVLPIASPTHKRAFCYIDDAVRIMRGLMASDAAINQAFNVGNEDQELSIAEMAETLIGVVGRTIPVEGGADHPGSPSRRCPDMAKTTRVSGVKAEVSLREGISRTYDWYRETVFEGDGVSAV